MTWCLMFWRNLQFTSRRKENKLSSIEFKHLTEVSWWVFLCGSRTATEWRCTRKGMGGGMNQRLLNNQFQIYSNLEGQTRVPGFCSQAHHRRLHIPFIPLIGCNKYTLYVFKLKHFRLSDFKSDSERLKCIVINGPEFILNLQAQKYIYTHKHTRETDTDR